MGCIIEARPSPTNSNGHHVSYHQEQYDDHQEVELETAASHSFISSPQNELLGGGESGSISKKHQQTQPATSLLHLGPKQHQVYDLVNEKAHLISSEEKLLETSTVAAVEQQHETIGSIIQSQNDDDNTSEEDDSCSGKADGYYQNLGSGCTSYYFCAAGYQATYVCPIGMKFNGKKCENDYVCPTTTTNGHHISNDCENKSNGYYPANRGINGGKYFYCFGKAKVIELQCDSGKIFVKDKCVLATSSPTSVTNKRVSQGETQVTPSSTTAALVKETSREGSSAGTALADASTSTCFRKSNGFYKDLESHCQKYYYCIGEEKTELRCQDGFVFNGDICVHQSRYECPSAFEKNVDEEQSELKEGLVVGSNSRKTVVIRSGEIARETGKLPIINRELNPLENDYQSSRYRSTDIKNDSTTTMNPSHLNVS